MSANIHYNFHNFHFCHKCARGSSFNNTNVQSKNKAFHDLNQGRSQNLKEVTQTFTEVFNIDDVTANGVIQGNHYHKEKK